MAGIITSVILFILSMLIFFAVRSSDKKERRLKNIQMQIKGFRSEAQATMQDIKTTSQDCIDSVQSHVAQARTTYEAVNGTLERLQAHKNDLTNLEGVCVNYKMSLEKLRTETEHVEARITNVQRETMKLEEIYSASRTFQEEADTLINQIQDFKAEYVRLVASTQESLKQQAMLQKKENTDMLSSFQSILDRQKAQFVEFMNNEKLGFQRECEDQLRIAESNGEKIRASRSEIDEALKNASTAFGDMKTDFRTFLENSDRKLQDGKGNLDMKLEEVGRNMDAKCESAKQNIADNLSSFESTTGELLEEFSKRRTQQEEILKEKQEEVSKLVADKKGEIDEYIKSAEHEIETLSRSMEKEKNSYLEKTRISYREALSEELEATRGVLENLKSLVDREVEELSSRSSEIRVATEELSRQSLEKISESIDRLSELGTKIKDGETTLTGIQENITSSREELYKLQQDHEKVEKLIEGSKDELKSMKDRVSDAKGERLELESDIAKLKLEKLKATDAERKSSEERIESMFETFPEDIFIGDEEEIDLNDDEEEESSKVDD